MNYSFFRRQAFTLVEMLVVVVIVGILITLATVSYTTARSKAGDAKKISDIRNVRVALEAYATKEGKYPDNLTFGQPLTGSNNRTYDQRLPNQPAGINYGTTCNNATAGQYFYKQLAGGKKYSLQYCLNGQVADCTQGLNLANGNIICRACPNGQCNICESDEDCSATEMCSNGFCVCRPESKDSFCSRFGKNCEFTGNDANCGTSRTENCGSCSGSESCGGGGTPGVCGCTPENDQQFCQNKNAQCGNFTGTDTCGINKTVSCGSCNNPTPICSNNQCVECLNNTNCSSQPINKICDTSIKKCVQCLTNSDCGTCQQCSNNTCQTATDGTDPKNDCPNITTCSNYVYGWSGSSCLGAAANGKNGLCYGGQCADYQSVCTGAGNVLATCLSDSCKNTGKCQALANKSDNDTVSEICFTDNQPHNSCSSPNKCLSTSLCAKCVIDNDCQICEKCSGGSCVARASNEAEPRCASTNKYDCLTGYCVNYHCNTYQDSRACGNSNEGVCKGGGTYGGSEYVGVCAKSLGSFTTCANDTLGNNNNVYKWFEKCRDGLETKTGYSSCGTSQHIGSWLVSAHSQGFLTGASKLITNCGPGKQTFTCYCWKEL